MSAATPEGQPVTPSDPDRAARLVVVAVGLAGAVLGYLLGAAGTPNDPVAAADTTTTTEQSPTTTTVASPPDRTLAELVPGFGGSLIVQMRTRLASWPSGRATPWMYDLPEAAWVEPDSVGFLLGVIGPGAGEDWPGSVLHLGTPGSMRPAAFGVRSFVWHSTDRGHLAWLQIVEGSDELELRVGAVTPDGRFSPGALITHVGDHENGISLVAWDAFGFVLDGWDFATRMRVTHLVDLDGATTSVPGQPVSASPDTVLVLRPFPEGGETVLVQRSLTDPRERRLEWAPREAGLISPAASSDGQRVAFLHPVTDRGDMRLEVWSVDGDLLVGFDIAGSHRVWDLEWDPGGRFLVAPGEILGGTDTQTVVLLFDTADGSTHEVGFPTWVERVFIRRL